MSTYVLREVTVLGAAPIVARGEDRAVLLAAAHERASRAGVDVTYYAVMRDGRVVATVKPEPPQEARS